MKSHNHRDSNRLARNNRQAQAKTRVEQRGQRTPEEQTVVLDDRLGAGIGAQRERARLAR